MSVTVQFEAKLVVDETITGFSDLVANPIVQHKISDGQLTLNATSSPKAEDVWSDERTLSAGSDTIDLTSLSSFLGSTKNFTGKRIQAMKIVAGPISGAANTANLVVADNATNGYLIFGSSTGELSLPPGASIVLFFKNGLADVSATVKQIAVTSTDTDAKYQIILVAGSGT